MSNADDAVVAVDIGGTKTAVAAVNRGGSLESVVRFPTPAISGPAAILESVVQAIGDVRRDSGKDLLAVGVGSAGMIKGGRVVAANETFPGWVGTDLSGELSERTGLAVAVVNDVDAHALGESWVGSAAGVDLMALVAVGTGVGATLVQHGELIVGAHGASGEVGHMPSAYARNMRCPCGRTGHLEAVASGPAILRRYRELADPQCVDTASVFERVRDDDTARLVVEEACSACADAIASIVAMVDPAVVAVGGGLALGAPGWWGLLMDKLYDKLPTPLSETRVVRAALGEGAALIGAGRLAWDLSGTVPIR